MKKSKILGWAMAGVLVALMVFAWFFVGGQTDEHAGMEEGGAGAAENMDSREGGGATSSADDRDVTSASFPSRVEGMNRVKLVTGDGAQREISTLHGMDFTFKEAFVASYANDSGERADIWVSVAFSDREAQELADRMADVIPRSPVFTEHQALELGGQTFHYVSGLGQEHYFYSRGDDVIWIGVTSHDLLGLFMELI